MRIQNDHNMKDPPIPRVQNACIVTYPPSLYERGFLTNCCELFSLNLLGITPDSLQPMASIHS